MLIHCILISFQMDSNRANNYKLNYNENKLIILEEATTQMEEVEQQLAEEKLGTSKSITKKDSDPQDVQFQLNELSFQLNEWEFSLEKVHTSCYNIAKATLKKLQTAKKKLKAKIKAAEKRNTTTEQAAEENKITIESPKFGLNAKNKEFNDIVKSKSENPESQFNFKSLYEMN